ncbi:MAG: AgmX/PglI C-terminal domain-containing protein, partial [Desulfatiglandales bacterium]
RIQGELRSNDASNIDITDLRTSKNLHRKRKNIYRLLLPKKGDVVLSDRFYSYLLRKVVRTSSPHIAEPPKERNPFYKNLVKSAGFHVFMMVFLGILISFPEMPRKQEPESRFVKIDTSRFKKKKPTPPPKRKSKPKKVKARPIHKQTPPKPPKKKVIVTAEKPKRKTKSILKKTRKPQRVALKNKRISKPSPKAGVGTGKKRNVSTRDVNQAGILGIIGDSIGFKPKEALAAITNLDAVSSPNADKRNFKVGGIVGKLDSPKIEIPSGAIVKTKGSAQVLRSAGAKGEGRVAALKQGKTGQKKVMAMVSVELDKTVRIRGGMSREQVKRIIDQHLHEISLCYENTLMNDPSLIGRIVFEWRVLASGRVGEVNIKSSSIKSNQLHSCIKRAIKSWQFPRPKNTEVVVSYPFVFDSVGF